MARSGSYRITIAFLVVHMVHKNLQHYAVASSLNSQVSLSSSPINGEEATYPLIYNQIVILSTNKLLFKCNNLTSPSKYISSDLLTARASSDTNINLLDELVDQCVIVVIGDSEWWQWVVIF